MGSALLSPTSTPMTSPGELLSPPPTDSPNCPKGAASLASSASGPHHRTQGFLFGPDLHHGVTTVSLHSPKPSPCYTQKDPPRMNSILFLRPQGLWHATRRLDPTPVGCHPRLLGSEDTHLSKSPLHTPGL